MERFVCVFLRRWYTYIYFAPYGREIHFSIESHTHTNSLLVFISYRFTFSTLTILLGTWSARVCVFVYSCVYGVMWYGVLAAHLLIYISFHSFRAGLCLCVACRCRWLLFFFLFRWPAYDIRNTYMYIASLCRRSCLWMRNCMRPMCLRDVVADVFVTTLS